MIPRDYDLLCARWSCKQLRGCGGLCGEAFVCELGSNAMRVFLRYENGVVKIGLVCVPLAKPLGLGCVHEH